MTPYDLTTAAPTRVVGIVNVTADSFSDGGDFLDTAAAVAHGRSLAADGAHLVDVGGESTRPGAQRVPVDVELARVVPVVAALADEGIPVSVDTMRAQVAAACVDAGAVAVNDVSGGLADPDMLAVVAQREVAYIAMHWRRHSATMDRAARYDDVVADVLRELGARRDAALAAGIAPDLLILDPGIGFAKTAGHNWTLLRHADSFAALGHPVLWGVSRKRFLSPLTDPPLSPRQRDTPSAVLTAHLAAGGVWGVRVHTVREHLAAVEVARRLEGEG